MLPCSGFRHHLECSHNQLNFTLSVVAFLRMSLIYNHVCIRITLRLGILMGCVANDLAATEAPILFSRDILPILSDNCFQCHGPDAQARKASLRLDQEIDLKETASSGRLMISPNQPDESELIRRVESLDPETVMPPMELGRPLSREDKANLRKWIEQGAAWGKHWSLEPIKRPTPPSNNPHPVDAFIDAKLEAHNLSAQPSAERSTLIRRLALDLTGLPPTSGDRAAIMEDSSEDWWENAIDRLLASPAYGERMAWEWLDAARYADSNGYQGDRERTMWPWRDWVVRAFNANMPWDQFTQWQLAGDLMPEATHEMVLATGFSRNHMINGEGGRIAEENRVDYVMDMTETMGTVWLGATLNCARCHDHKFDAITQQDYYRLFDFFNQTPVNGGGGDPQTPPVLAVPNPDQSARLIEARQSLEEAEAFNDKTLSSFNAIASVWESRQLEALTSRVSTEPANEEEAPKRQELQELLEALKTLEPERDDAARALIRKHAMSTWPPLIKSQQELEGARAHLKGIEKEVPKVMVMAEQPKRRTTHRLERGLYYQQKESLLANVPTSLPPLMTESHQAPNRLDLARWLTQKEHPLTARVTVNRFWQQLFGIGLVKTTEDFGVQGERPEHLALLDWLAAEFMETGWDVKGLLRTILTSEAYRRRSETTDQLQEMDPENRLLARGSRYRMASWMIRDQALSASGLLDPRLGGPPVNGYQPDGVWEEATFGNKQYTMDEGRKLYRRSLYTFWRRIIAPTLFFDAASRQSCNVNTRRTNSPLHALTTLNDTTFVEASRSLAARAMEEKPGFEERLQWVYQCLLCRDPSEGEQAVWKASLERARDYFQSDASAAEAWLSTGGFQARSSLDTRELAAWSAVALGILNLDETFNRE